METKQAGAPEMLQLNLLEEDASFKKTSEVHGLIEGTHFVRDERKEFAPETLLHTLSYILGRAGTPMSNDAIIFRLRYEVDAHHYYEQIMMTEKRLDQLANLHQYHDTFLKESHEALRLELFMIEERLVGAQDKKVVDKKGQDVDVDNHLNQLEVDMREVFKLIADYSEVFDNYKDAIAELRSIHESSPAAQAVAKIKEKKQAAANAASAGSAEQEPRVFGEGEEALMDLSAFQVARNTELDVQIEELIKEMQLFHGKRVDLNERFDFIIQEIQKTGSTDYVPVEGDLLDA